MEEKSRRGFAGMMETEHGRKLQKMIASEGGKTAHIVGKAHEFTSEEGKAAGKKGGEAISRDKEHMRAIGRRGGFASGKARKSRG